MLRAASSNLLWPAEKAFRFKMTRIPLARLIVPNAKQFEPRTQCPVSQMALPPAARLFHGAGSLCAGSQRTKKIRENIGYSGVWIPLGCAMADVFSARTVTVHRSPSEKFRILSTNAMFACSPCSWPMTTGMNFASVDWIYPALAPAARSVLRPSYGDSSQSSLASITNLAESPWESIHVRFVNLVVDTAGGPTGFLSYCWKLRWASGKLNGAHGMCGAGNAGSTHACGYWVRGSSPLPLTLYLCVHCAPSPSRHHPQGSLKSHHTRPFRSAPQFLLSRRHHLRVNSALPPSRHPHPA